MGLREWMRLVFSSGSGGCSGEIKPRFEQLEARLLLSGDSFGFVPVDPFANTQDEQVTEMELAPGAGESEDTPPAFSARVDASAEDSTTARGYAELEVTRQDSLVYTSSSAIAGPDLGSFAPDIQGDAQIQDASGKLPESDTDGAGVGDYATASAAIGLSITDVRLDEGDSGTTVFNFVVTLSRAGSQTVSVDYVTGTYLNHPSAATYREDYRGIRGTLTIAAGQTSGIITVAVYGDATAESDEQFCVQLSNARHATIIDGEATGTILNDDASLRPQAVLVSDVPAYEWYFGCSPTSFGMIMGYWDGLGYDNLIPGDAFLMTQAVKDTIASPQHITAGQENQPGGWYYDGYGDWHNSTSYPYHESNPDSIADFIKTVDGGSYPSNYESGILSFLNYRGYDGWSVSRETWHQFGWSDLTAAIDAGLPLVFSVDSDGNGGTDHAITVIGYDATTHEYATFNTWYTTVAWYPFAPVQPGNVYGVSGVTQVSPGEGPTDILLSDTDVAENQPASTVVGTLSTVDLWDASSTFAYTLVSGEGSTDNRFFKIRGNTLQTSRPFDYETKQRFSIRIRSMAYDGQSIEKSFIISVTDVNDAPQFASTPVTTGTIAGTYTYDIVVTDVDAGDALTITAAPTWLTLTDHGDGTATLSGTPTLDEVGNHAVTLTVSDSDGLTDTQEFTVTVTQRSIRLGDGRKCQFTDASGDLVTVTLKGGAGYLYFAQAGDCDLDRIELFNTTAKSSLKIAAKRAGTTVKDIVVHGSLKDLKAKTTELRGSVTIDGTLKTLVMGDALADHVISIGASVDPKAAATLVFKRIADMLVNSLMPIKSLTATEWLGGSVSAPWISSLSIKGKLDASGNIDVDLDLYGQNAKGVSLKKARISGQITGGCWDIEGDTNCIKAGGAGADWELDVEGFVKTLDGVQGLAGTLSALGFGKVVTRGSLSVNLAADYIKKLRFTDVDGKHALKNLDAPEDSWLQHDLEIWLI